MKNSKRILSVTIKRMLDESPDTSWLGEYSDHATSDFSIDRRHSLDCPINSGTDNPLCWFTTGSGRIELQMTLEQAESGSHSGQCDEDVEYLSKQPAIASQLAAIDAAVLAAELKEYGAWDETERANHAQNLQRILWLACGDISDNNGCNCGEHGDMSRNEYRYFNPSFNYVDKNGKATDTPENVRKYVRQDYERMERLNAGDWCFIGIRAEANYVLKSWGRWETDKQMFTGGCGPIQTLTSGGLWGIESDSDTAYMESVEQQELSDLKTQLLALGFSKRSVSAAFREVVRKDA